MRLIVKKEPVRRMLRWAVGVLFGWAVLLLGYCGFALADAWNFQRQESRDFDRLVRDQHAVATGTPQPKPSRSAKIALASATPGLIGRIEIPRLLVSAVVVEGIDRTTLRRAVGHIPGTALPGQPGNVGLSGHRDTLFRPLKDLKINDEVHFSTLKGNFKYQVESLTVVEPDNVGVLARSDENVLTLVTCYPFYYVGPAPRRFIVRARLVPETVAVE